MKVVNRRASSKYVTPPSACKVTLFSAEREATESYYRLGFWAQLAGGGVDVRPIEGEGITHFEIMKEPHVQSSRPSLTRCIAEAPGRRGPERLHDRCKARFVRRAMRCTSGAVDLRPRCPTRWSRC